MSPPPIVLIHGLWLTPRSWERWIERFEARGREVLAPAWPRMPGEVEEVRRDPSPLDGLGVREVVDHHAAIVAGLERPPVLVGHSLGGLVVELLLDRGLGAAGVAVSPVAIKGVLRLPLAQIRAAWPVLSKPANRRRTVMLTPRQFHFAFTTTMAPAEARAVYERYAIPGPGRPVFQAATANLNPRAVTRVDAHDDDRPPLLVIGNERDTIVPASTARASARRLARSRAVVEYREFAERPHFAGAPGWEELADASLAFADRHTGVVAERREAAPA